MIQDTELVAVEALSIQPATPGNEPFQVQTNSFNNGDAGAGTYNHGTWIGWNAGLHAGGPKVVGKPSMMIGFEDNYYDLTGDKSFGTEWYVQSWSPDGVTVQMSRPFYTRGRQYDDGTDTWTTICNIGSKGTARQYTIRAGTTNLVTVLPNHFTVSQPATFDNNVELGGNAIVANSKFVQMKRADGVVCSVWGIDSQNTLNVGDILNQVPVVKFRAGGSAVLTLKADKSVAVGPGVPLATGASGGHFYIPTCQGQPTGTPSGQVGSVAQIYDTVNDKLWIYNGGWKSAQFA